MNLKAVPPIQSKTSLPQTWHIPQRTAGLTPKAVDCITIHKVKPPSRGDKIQPPEEPPKKAIKRNVEGIIPSLYCPVQPTIPAINFTNHLIKELKCISSDAQLLQIVPDPLDPLTSRSVETKFGDVPHGSVLSYQQKVNAISSGSIINIVDAPPYPWFPLPEQPHAFEIVLTNAQQEIFQGIHITASQSKEIELETRQQSQNNQWHALRLQRLTSSYFKQIYSRKKDFETLATRLLKRKKVQTRAMRYGIEHEPEAAKLYAQVSGNNVSLCGFVVNPSAPHLGTSPDRRVYDPLANPPYGLLEIKCLSKLSYTEADCLQKINGRHRLKRIHSYFIQIMGQMGLSGCEWCDFFICCLNDYHLERVFYNQQKWEDIKTKLDMFYFQYSLPKLCK